VKTPWTRKELLGVLVGPCERALATACSELELEVVVEVSREVPAEDLRVEEPMPGGLAEVAPRAVPRLRMRASAAAGRVNAAGAALGAAAGLVSAGDAASRIVPGRVDAGDVVSTDVRGTALVVPPGVSPEPSRVVSPTVVPPSGPFEVGMGGRMAAVAWASSGSGFERSNVPNVPRVSTGTPVGVPTSHAPASPVSPMPHLEAAASVPRAANATSREAPRGPRRRPRVLERLRTAREVNAPPALLSDVDVSRTSLPTPFELPELAPEEHGAGAVPFASGSSTSQLGVLGAAEPTRPVAAIDGPRVKLGPRSGAVAAPATASPFAALSGADSFAGLTSELVALAASASPGTAAASLAALMSPAAAPTMLVAAASPGAVAALAAAVSPAAAPTTLAAAVLPAAAPTTLAAAVSPAAAPTTLAAAVLPAAAPTTLAAAVLPAAAPTTLAAAVLPAAAPTTLAAAVLPAAAPTTLAVAVSPVAAPKSHATAASPVPTTLAGAASLVAAPKSHTAASPIAPSMLAPPSVPLAFTGASAARRETWSPGPFVPPTPVVSPVRPPALAPRVASFGVLARPSSSNPSTEASPCVPASPVDEDALAELLARAARRHGIEL